MRAVILSALFVTMVLAGCLSSNDDTGEGSDLAGPAGVAHPTTIDREDLGDNETVFQTLGPDENFTRESAWRIVNGTGNCCENYVTSTPEGRILDFGGTFVHYSDDEGITWETVPTPIPYRNGEGAIARAPGGDIVAIGWDPYTGDQVYSHKYDASTGEWLWAASPLHTPFWDREWIVALPGPFNIDGEEYPYISLARGGGFYKEVLLMSTDGLNYNEISSADMQVMLASGPSTLTAFDAEPDWERDWIQPLRQMTISTMGPGVGLQTFTSFTGTADSFGRETGAGEDATPGEACPRLFHSDATWSCLELEEAVLPDGAITMDSAGSLHVIDTHRTSFTYKISHDGGRSWESTNYLLPNNTKGNNTLLSDWDFKVNAALDQTIVAVHTVLTQGTDDNFTDDTGQDLVYRFHGLNGTPYLQEILVVGDGAGEPGEGGVSNSGDRYDFMNTAMLPDGRVVVSIQDSNYSNPVLAIELWPEPVEETAQSQ